MSTATDTRVVIERAALDFVDQHGVDALTLRALGQAIGMHHTAIYRHYASRDELLGAVMGSVVQSALDQMPGNVSEPRERLLALIRGLRRAFYAHPAVASAALLATSQIASADPARRFVGLVLQALQDAGLDGPSRALWFRILEGYGIGMTVFDYAGAPDHLESRRQRYREVPDETFETITRNSEGIDILNEEAFDAGLIALVDACMAAASSKQ